MRTYDKAKNMRRVNMLFEQRTQSLKEYGEFDNHELQGQEDFYDNMNQNGEDDIEGGRMFDGGGSQLSFHQASVTHPKSGKITYVAFKQPNDGRLEVYGFSNDNELYKGELPPDKNWKGLKNIKFLGQKSREEADRFFTQK